MDNKRVNYWGAVAYILFGLGVVDAIYGLMKSGLRFGYFRLYDFQTYIGTISTLMILAIGCKILEYLLDSKYYLEDIRQTLEDSTYNNNNRVIPPNNFR